MAIVAPFTPGHLLKLSPKKGDAETIAEMAGTATKLLTIGAKTMLTPKGTVLGIMGAVPSIPGVCEVFIIASEGQKNFPISFARCVQKELCRLRLKYRRIEARTANDEFHKRWISWLGFEYEGIMRRYGLHGEDMILWSLIQ